jgi:hypothetical protein
MIHTFLMEIPGLGIMFGVVVYCLSHDMDILLSLLATVCFCLEEKVKEQYFGMFIFLTWKNGPGCQ